MIETSGRLWIEEKAIGDVRVLMPNNAPDREILLMAAEFLSQRADQEEIAINALRQAMRHAETVRAELLQCAGNLRKEAQGVR